MFLLKRESASWVTKQQQQVNSMSSNRITFSNAHVNDFVSMENCSNWNDENPHVSWQKNVSQTGQCFFFGDVPEMYKQSMWACADHNDPISRLK